MPLLLDSLTFGLVVTFMLLGLLGVIVPVLPGMVLVWLSLLVYTVANGFTTISPFLFGVLTLVALVTGTADFWLSWLGAKKGGASRRSILLGVVGSLIGTIFLPLIGTVLGYGLGILLGEYQKRGDWEAAWRASLGGVAGWGVATAVQLAGALLIVIIFVWRVLAA